MRDFKFTEQERPTMANFNARLDAIAALANGIGNEYVWLRNDGTYVNSPVPSAYPPAESDGYTYTALGKLGAKTQIATGSYVGTGTYGSSNPNSLTFDFVPKFVVIKKKNAKFGYYGQLGVYLDGGTTLVDISENSESGCNASVSGNTLSWYSTKYNSQQFNDSTHDGGYYSYIAIG